MQAVAELARQIGALHPSAFSSLLVALRKERKLTPGRPPHPRDLIDVMDDIAEIQAEVRTIIFPPEASPPHLPNP